ncbi:hypothetical protein HCG49_16930 [Arenibacter sp. 6A1]|uniref:hypothetical protein n=1 Tax=Arenibacter sp. 6A1 TaxID=2720391 RepID=UPI0014480D54|nr:hypothetical protein [Arenibacter sp. 6A1]NKI28240.1 hypothetical protein [Arenibacter sp. 6A1]
MKTTFRTNTLETQKLTSELLKIGVRVFPEPVVSYGNTVKGYQIRVERKLNSGKWGMPHTFKKIVKVNEWEDAMVRTIEHVHREEFKLKPIKNKP